MKKYVFTLFALILLAGTSCQEKIDVEKENDAIIAVNEEERNAYLDHDITRLEAIWVQKSTSQRIFTSENALTILNGWTEIYTNYRESIDSEWWKDTEDLFASFSNYEINLYDNTALVYHDIKWTGKYLGEEMDFKQKRVIHFVKVEGTWKFDFTAQLEIPAEKEEIEEEPETEDTE
ncbi:unnamed protein product [marine sediment metagenome]|uniref:SnoaL-like domain-containing protein n=1 Tax=marine sediment metagenome TaxID=412755 RepID=X1CGD0_9ZZZZ